MDRSLSERGLLEAAAHSYDQELSTLAEEEPPSYPPPHLPPPPPPIMTLDPATAGQQQIVPVQPPTTEELLSRFQQRKSRDRGGMTVPTGGFYNGGGKHPSRASSFRKSIRRGVKQATRK